MNHMPYSSFDFQCNECQKFKLCYHCMTDGQIVCHECFLKLILVDTQEIGTIIKAEKNKEVSVNI
jgi:hypothetical protein